MNRLFPLIPMLFFVLASCTVFRSPSRAMPHAKATLNGQPPMDPLQWRVITCQTNPQESTMSTLFGNDAAIYHSRRHGESDYPPGSMMALVTWRQQDDTRWFGARMPAETKSVEMVIVGVSDAGQPSYLYEDYRGSPLKKIEGVEAQAKARVNYLLSQRAAVMP